MDAVNQILSFFAICAALYGINSWRKEHVGKRKIELAEETLVLFYQAVDAIRHIRNPMAYGSEMSEVEKENNETNEKFKARQQASVVSYRYNEHQELFSKIHASRYRFMVLVGKEKTVPFDELREILRKIMMSARMLSILWASNHSRTEQQQKIHYESIDKHEAIFWDGLEEDDPINPKLEKIIKEMEETCQAVIEGKNVFGGFCICNIF